jgi:hypothetical protein
MVPDADAYWSRSCCCCRPELAKRPSPDHFQAFITQRSSPGHAAKPPQHHEREAVGGEVNGEHGTQYELDGALQPEPEDWLVRRLIEVVTTRRDPVHEVSPESTKTTGQYGCGRLFHGVARLVRGGEVTMTW